MYLAERLIDGGGRGYRYKNIRRTGNTRSPPPKSLRSGLPLRLVTLRTSFRSASLRCSAPRPRAAIFLVLSNHYLIGFI